MAKGKDKVLKVGGSEHQQYKKGLWGVEEDRILMDYVHVHGTGQWNRIAKKTGKHYTPSVPSGLRRCGKSCRLRWMNYLSPNVRHDTFSEQEEDLIIRMHRLLGNRWSLIAKRVPGRTDNQVKNYWNTHLSKKLGLKPPHITKDRGGDRENLCSKPDKAGSDIVQVTEANRDHDDGPDGEVMKSRVCDDEKEWVPSSDENTSWLLQQELEPMSSGVSMMDYFFNGYSSNLEDLA